MLTKGKGRIALFVSFAASIALVGCSDDNSGSGSPDGGTGGAMAGACVTQTSFSQTGIMTNSCYANGVKLHENIMIAPGGGGSASFVLTKTDGTTTCLSFQAMQSAGGMTGPITFKDGAGATIFTAT